MEYALRANAAAFDAVVIDESLNPCFSGICAARVRCKKKPLHVAYVLILVLVEYALRVINNLNFRQNEN